MILRSIHGLRVMTIAVLGVGGCSNDRSVAPSTRDAVSTHATPMTDPIVAAKQGPPMGGGGVALSILDLAAGDWSVAEAVNDKGQIVGTGGPGTGAFLWENGTIRQLGALPGMTFAQAEDINENGQVVGYSGIGSQYHAFIWTVAGGMQPLAGSLGGCCTLARAINDQGVVLGEARLAGGGAHAVVWENGVMRDIQSFATGSTFPWDLSNSGIAVGQWNTSTAGFVWTAGAGMTVLAGLDGEGDVPIGVNDLGQIVGWHKRTPGDINKAFLWDNGVVTDLGTLGGASSVGTAINNAGQVVGRADLPRKGPRAFIWTAAGGMKDLGLSRDRHQAQALDINETGWIVGTSWARSGATRATLWKIE